MSDLVLTIASKYQPVAAFVLPLCLKHARTWREEVSKHGMEVLEERREHAQAC